MAHADPQPCYMERLQHSQRWESSSSGISSHSVQTWGAGGCSASSQPQGCLLVPATDTAPRLRISGTGGSVETGTESVTQPPKNQIPAPIHSPKLSWRRGGSHRLTFWLSCKLHRAIYLGLQLL